MTADQDDNAAKTLLLALIDFLQSDIFTEEADDDFDEFYLGDDFDDEFDYLY